MKQQTLPFDFRTETDLLTTLIGSPQKSDSIAKEFRLGYLSSAHRQELGLTPTQYEKLSAAIELGKRVTEAEAVRKNQIAITSSTDAIDYCENRFWRLIQNATQEEFHIATLNTKNIVIDTHQITVGTLDASLVHPREVFKKAIRDSASSILLVHNHPSGDGTPSREDLAVTKRLEQAGEIIGINVLDHIVLGLTGSVSIMEQRI